MKDKKFRFYRSSNKKKNINSLIKKKSNNFFNKKKKNHTKAIISIHKRTESIGYFNNVQRFKKILFFKFFIKSTIKSGKIGRSYKILEKLAKIVKKKYKMNVYKFMDEVYNNIIPILGSKS
jgi:hypothetical protein